ncbi:unnamed protein product [Parascedosporium putredinis]|uniref:NB-ARC domain-containing protein n=1 Tax=Parascedosporium putredinis TaxID=1442378 RepID=A0A9P1H796_9PEZI|nr:unnamed protein product [Parascedosporium putredinis]CAI7998323.1 unnamed protein product [Parascedosporium putredinis]
MPGAGLPPFSCLMAIMLGRLRMNTEEVIEEYERLAERVFHKKNRRLDFSFRERALEECIKETIEQREKAAHSSGMGKPHGTRMLDIHNHSDKGLTFVVAMQRGGDEDTPVLFRTYRSHEKPMDCEIWEAARATSAAPMIFKPASVRIDNETRSYIDAAVKWNNPSKIVLNEAKTHFGGDRSLGCLLSLGTGLRPHALDPNAKKSRWLSYNVGELKRMMTDFLTDPEEAHLELAARLSDCPDTYFRLSLPILPELGRAEAYYTSRCIHLGWLKDTKPSARYFTGRQDILQRMDEFLHERDPASSPRREVWLHGIGGVGKTQIAHRFADQFGDRIQGMASQIYPGQTEPVNPQVIISWLQNTDSSWLMVVDNYDSGDINISRYLPNSQKGNIIFTSRQSYMLPRTGQCFIEIHVEEMAVKDSVELLRRTADLGLDAEDTILEAEKLVQDLGCLPLAIDQAGSYIGSYGCTVQEYRKTLKKRLKDVRYQDAVSEKGVYASFDLAFDHFRHESQHSSTTIGDYITP